MSAPHDVCILDENVEDIDWDHVATFGLGVILFFNLLKTLAKDGLLVNVGKVYLKYYFKKGRKLRPGLIVTVMFLNRCVTHWHFYKFTRDTLAGQNAAVMTAGMNG